MLFRGPYVIDKNEGDIDTAEKSWIYFKRVLYWLYISGLPPGFVPSNVAPTQLGVSAA